VASKENNKYAKSISGHVDGNDLGAVSMQKTKEIFVLQLCENRQTAAFFCLKTINCPRVLFAEISHVNNIGIFLCMTL